MRRLVIDTFVIVDARLVVPAAGLNNRVRDATSAVNLRGPSTLHGTPHVT